MLRLLVVVLGLVFLRTLEPVPENGFDLRYQGALHALGLRTARCIVRIEAVRRLPPPFDPAYPSVVDGAGIFIEPGQILTTAAYLQGADTLTLQLRDGTRLPARILRTDAASDLTLLTYDPTPKDKATPAELGLVPATIAHPPDPHPETHAAEVWIPTVLMGDVPSGRSAALVRADAWLLSGLALNGVPAFDRFARVVALARHPTPDRSRSVAIPGADIAAFLGRRPEPAAPARDPLTGEALPPKTPPENTDPATQKRGEVGGP